MKNKFLFIAGILTFIPAAALAAYGGSYDFIVGNGITTIPCFIQAALGIVVKVGIPVASIFIIFSGFQFLTAQGNEAKLTAAKKSFLWSCIGFGVLIGAWLFATAIMGTITAITGGSAQGSACGQANSVSNSNTNAAKPPAYIAGASASTCQAQDYYGGSLSPLQADPMEENGLESTDPNLFQKSLALTQNDAINKTNEQNYVYVTLGTGDGALLHTANGEPTRVADPSISTINTYIVGPLLEKPQKITFIHTHPKGYAGDINVPPSADDIVLAAYYNDKSAASGTDIPYDWVVSDPTGSYKYTVPPDSILGQMPSRAEKFRNLPEVQGVDFCKATAEQINAISWSPESLSVFQDYAKSTNRYNEYVQQDMTLEEARLKGDTSTVAQVLQNRSDMLREDGVTVEKVN
jgi:hypothetical protein